MATRTCDAVSIAFVHSPVKPIKASIASVVSAGLRPEMRKAMSASPNVMAGHGVSTKKLRNGPSPCCTMKFPTGFVMWKTNVDGSWT